MKTQDQPDRGVFCSTLLGEPTLEVVKVQELESLIVLKKHKFPIVFELPHSYLFDSCSVGSRCLKNILEGAAQKYKTHVQVIDYHKK